MAVDLRCPNCGDNLGKDTENSALAYCGNCGEKDIYNERGDMYDMTKEEIAKFRKISRARGKLFRRSRW